MSTTPPNPQSPGAVPPVPAPQKSSGNKILFWILGIMKSRGFTVSKMTGPSEGKTGGIVSGQDKANNRTVVATIGTENDHTQVSVTFSAKQ
jgi:hypothetical protein